jgi:hypothetical protein
VRPAGNHKPIDPQILRSHPYRFDR